MAGIKTQVYFNPSVKIKKKFAYADKLGIPFVAVIGEEEVKNNAITIKNMLTGKQDSIPLTKFENLIYLLKMGKEAKYEKICQS